MLDQDLVRQTETDADRTQERGHELVERLVRPGRICELHVLAIAELDHGSGAERDVALPRLLAFDERPEARSLTGALRRDEDGEEARDHRGLELAFGVA